MRTLIIFILIVVSDMSFASTKDSYQKVNPKFKAGTVEIDRDRLILNAESNVISYLNYTNWSEKKNRAFMDAYKKIIIAIQKGYISERDLSRSWIDSSGVISNTTKGFDANGAVCQFLDTIVDALVERSYYEPVSSSPQQNNSYTNDKGNLNDITRILKKNK